MNNPWETAAKNWQTAYELERGNAVRAFICGVFVGALVVFWIGLFIYWSRT